MKAAQRGVTLIELTAFILIVSICVMALLSMYRSVLPHGATPAEITQATQLAQERMEIVLGHRVAGGYSGLNDPCTVGGAGAICSQFGARPGAGAGAFTVVVNGGNSAVSWTISSVAYYREIGVTVLGADGGQLAELSAVVANY